MPSSPTPPGRVPSWSEVTDVDAPRPRSSWPGAPQNDAPRNDASGKDASKDGGPVNDATRSRAPEPGRSPRGASSSNGPRRGPADTPGPLRVVATLLLAVLAALLVWVVATPVAGLDLHAGGWSISPGAIIPAVLVPGILAWVLRIAFEPSPRGAMIWTIIAVVVLALSLLSPVVMGAGSMGLVALLAMHVLVGVVLILGLHGPRGPVHASRTPRTREGGQPPPIGGQPPRTGGQPPRAS